MEDKILRFTLRIDKTTLNKLGYIAECENRTKNGELLQAIKRRIAEFEKANGRIELDYRD